MAHRAQPDGTRRLSSQSWWEGSMQSGILRGTLLTLSVLAFGAAVATAQQPDQKGHQNRGAVTAKSVAPGQMRKFHVTAYDGKIAPSTLRVQRGDKVQITFVSKDSTYSSTFQDFE